MKDKDKKKPTYQMRSVNPAESVAVEKPDGYTGTGKRRPNPDINIRQLKSRLLRVKP